MKDKFYYLLHPRPVYIIGSGSIDNKEINFMAASWVMPVSEDIPTVALASDKTQYTTELIEKYKQFSINIVDDYKLIWNVGTTSGRKIKKHEKFNIKFMRGKVLDVPIIDGSIGYLEVKVINRLEVAEVYLYIGQVMNYDGNIDLYYKIPSHKGKRVFVFYSKDLYYV